MRSKLTVLMNLTVAISLLVGTAVFVSCKDEGKDNMTPGPAGVITGDEEGEESVTLTIAEINHATAYKWYKDGTEVQNSASRTYIVTRSGVYKVAGINEFGEGEASPEKRVTITNPQVNTELPADAGEISGDETGDRGVSLSIDAIERADTYKWYKDGSEVQNTSSRTFTATEGGIYKVAGVNEKGEGKASPEKTVTITGTSNPNLPADAPVILGSPQARERVPLIIEGIDRADTYKWYKDGIEIPNSSLPAYVALESGVYTVAGVNSYGEGKPSPPKSVTVGEVTFTKMTHANAAYLGDFRNTNTGLFLLDLYRVDGDYFDCVIIEGFIPLASDPNNVTLPAERYELKLLFDFANQPYVLHPGLHDVYGEPYGTYWYRLNRNEDMLDYSFAYKGFMDVSRTGDNYTVNIEFEAQTTYMIAEYFYYTYTGKIDIENYGDQVDQTTLTIVEDAEYYGKSHGSQNDHFLINLNDQSSFPLFNFTVSGYAGTNGSFDDFSLPSGTYTISDKDEPFAIEPGGVFQTYLVPTCYSYFETEDSGYNVALTSGTMEVENKGGDLYKLIIDMKGTNLHTGKTQLLDATYEGTIVFTDESAVARTSSAGQNPYRPYRIPIFDARSTKLSKRR